MVAKVEFQRNLRNLVVQNRPEFEALADVNIDLQILFAEARRKSFEYLLAHDPDRIDTTNGLSQLENQNNGHPDWPELREYFRAKLTRSPEFSSVTARFQDRQSKVDARITQCRRN